MDGAKYANKIKEKIKFAKHLKEYGTILARLYRKAIENNNHKHAEKMKNLMVDTKEILDNLEIYPSKKEREYSTEEIEQLLDKK